MKIPKIIYTTWISDKDLPVKFYKYIESWKRILPDYEIRMITLENAPRNRFSDICINNKKFAVAAQYARIQRIFETGGLYFDVDVEAVKSFDDLLDYEMFAGIESKSDNNFINNAVFGAHKEHPFLKECLEELDKINLSIKDIEVSTGPLMFTKLMKRRGWIPENKNIYLNGIQIFNSEYFYPYCPDEQFTSDCISQNTYAVHHWAATWKNSVSIIILSGQKFNQLIQSIEIATTQSVKPIEVIVMNGTHDYTKSIKGMTQLSKVKFLDSGNGNSSSVKNAGIDFAKGRWILILKPDDKIDHAFIEKTIDKGDIVGLNPDTFKNIGDTKSKSGCFLVKKEVWETINGFDETLTDGTEDADFLNRARYEGYNVKVVND
ncbi:MAG TPA: glycosyltransferase [Ignavibacteria bacterium]|nr:hypothetical protein [Bacteroidota bacterium]HRI86124.1 glycosyltransferase [Ignavibacteria bacterium]HRK00446.1 glycosyltransferase [Ignavibacteria bacterium]